MKNLKLLFLLAASMFIFQACNDDETAKEGEIEGTWNVDSFSVDLTINGESFSEFFTQSEADAIEDLLVGSFEDSFEGATIEFKSDGNYTSTSDDGSTDSGTWSLNSDGTALTLDGGTAEEFTFDVLTATKSALVLNYSETESQDIDFDGTADEITTSLDLNLSK